MPRTRTPSTRLALTLLAAGSPLACNDPVGSDTPYVVTPVTSTDLSGTPGWALTDTLVVEVRDAEGRPVAGTAVHWSLPNGGSLAVQLAEADDRLTGTTDHRGRNYAVWTLGLGEGTQVARAAAGTESSASFTATATALHALQVTVGAGYACAVLTDQRPVCWGDNQYGQLGVGDQVHRATPTGLDGLGAVLEIRASGSWHTCARDMAGDVWCWGANIYGDVGSLAAFGPQVAPVRVPGAAGATTVALGYTFSCAILAAGGARCWGSNDAGRLGAGFWSVGGTNNPVPQVVVGGGDFVQLGMGGDRVCAVDVNWEAWCWGNAGGGVLSPYPSNNYNAPVRPVPGYKFSEVAVNWNTNCGITLGGGVLCWGINVGLGRESSAWLTTAPIRPSGEGSFAQLTSSSSYILGRTRDGRLVRWGYSDCCGEGVPGGRSPWHPSSGRLLRLRRILHYLRIRSALLRPQCLPGAQSSGVPCNAYPVTVRQLSLGGIPAVSLSNDELELVVAPTLGMKICNLRRRRGREWLWRNPAIPYQPGVPGSSYVETADSGGWDECFPTVLPSRLPGAPDGTPPLPDHGELWSARWEARVYEHADGGVISGTARGVALPYEFTREISLAADEPVVVMRYRVRHTGGAPFPWLWAANPTFSVRPGMRIVLPTVAQVRCSDVFGRCDWERGAAKPWPLCGEGDAFVFPENSGWAVMAHADIGRSGRMLLEDPEAAEWVDLLVEPGEVPQVGLWLNCGGWSPGGGHAYYNCSIQPGIGAPRRLEEVVGDWGVAPTLHPGEERAWRLTLGLWTEED